MNLNSEYEQLLKILKQLPLSKIRELKTELSRELNEKKPLKKASSFRGILKGIDIDDFEDYLKKSREE